MHVYFPYLVGCLRNFTMNRGSVARLPGEQGERHSCVFMFTAQPYEELKFRNFGNMFFNSLTTYSLYKKEYKKTLKTDLMDDWIP